MTQTIPSIGQTYQNVCFFDNPDGGLTALQIAGELAANFMPRIQNFQSNFLGWQFLHIYDANDHDDPVYIHPLNNSPGLANTGYIYPTLCYKISLQAVIGGRRGRGRFFVAGGRNDWMTAGGITASAATNGGIHIAALMARYSVTGNGPIKWVIYHRANEDQSASFIASALLRPYMGMQRRRNYGIGI
jgi:hypothetical protein